MLALFFALIAVVVVSLISLIGVFALAISDQTLKGCLIYLVSFSAGSLIGGSFFHLLPEALEQDDNSIKVFIFVLAGFCLFFILERILRWHHCHNEECQTHAHLGWLNLIGDGIHNVIDGLVIISSFSVSPALGIPVTLSIIFHEVPQEIGDFGVLIYSGFSKAKAIFYNFLSALTAVAGVIIGYFLLDRILGINEFLLAFAAGGFIYIAASDLVPEIHQDRQLGRAVVSFLIFLVALVLMLVLKVIGNE